MLVATGHTSRALEGLEGSLPELPLEDWLSEQLAELLLEDSLPELPLEDSLPELGLEDSLDSEPAVVGASVEASVGAFVGTAEGVAVVGALVGTAEGVAVVGVLVGSAEGAVGTNSVGAAVGVAVVQHFAGLQCWGLVVSKPTRRGRDLCRRSVRDLETVPLTLASDSPSGVMALNAACVGAQLSDRGAGRCSRMHWRRLLYRCVSCGATAPAACNSHASQHGSPHFGRSVALSKEHCVPLLTASVLLMYDAGRV